MELNKPADCGRSCLLSMIFVVFLDMLGLSIAIPVLASLFIEPNGVLAASVPFSTRTILYGFVIASYPLAQFFGAPILGALSDRHGRKKILLLSLIGTLLGYIIFAAGIFTRSIPLLFLGRIIDGVTGGNISIAMSAIADVSDKNSKARNFGLIGMAFGFGFIIGPFIGGVLSDPTLVPWFNSATPFIFAAGLTLINIIILLLIFPETLRKKVHAPISALTGFRNIGRAMKMNNLRVMFIVIFLLAFGFNFFTQFIQVFLIEKFSYTERQIGIYFAFVGFWIAFAQGVITRPLSRKFRPEQIIMVSPLLLSLALPILLFPAKPIYLYFIMPFTAIFQGLTYPNSTAIVSNLSGEESQGEILGINQSVQSLAMAIPPIIAGFIASISVSLPIIVASVTVFCAWLLFITAFGKKKEQLFHEV